VEKPVKDKGKHKKIKIIIGSIIGTYAIVIFVLLSYSEKLNKKLEATKLLTAMQQSDIKPEFEVLSSSMKTENNIRYVTGRIQNNTDKTFNYVQVEINLYDLNDNFIGSTLDNVNNFEPSTVWYFKALAIDDKAKKYKIMNISWLD
jgi:hypothetical protein